MIYDIINDIFDYYKPKDIIITLAIFIVIVLIVKAIVKNRYKYPYYKVSIDISGRRNVNYTEAIEEYVLDNGIEEFVRHMIEVEKWKNDTYLKAHNALFRNLRVKQYLEVIDDDNTFIFEFYRMFTGYRQINYTKYSYKSRCNVECIKCEWRYIYEIYGELRKIGFETTTQKYFEENQRKLMTSKLRDKIMERDNYTCQICGRYMPDKFGIHIDHIIPVSKGGKTVESNLRVLCSSCNLHKSDKIE